MDSRDTTDEDRERVAARWRWILDDPDEETVHELATAAHENEHLRALVPSVSMGRTFRLEIGQCLPYRDEILFFLNEDGTIEVRHARSDLRVLTDSVGEAVAAAATRLDGSCDIEGRHSRMA
jgi:hypothetical protein